jgi:hypothetical protein
MSSVDGPCFIKKWHKKKSMCNYSKNGQKRGKKDETLQRALPFLPDSGSSVALVPPT